MQHLSSKACALRVARRRNTHSKCGGQQLGMLGSQSTQAQGVLLAPARTALGRLRASTKWQQWLQLPAMASLPSIACHACLSSLSARLRSK